MKDSMIPRFLREYASCKKGGIKNNPFWDKSWKEKAYEEIDRILRNRRRGLITVDEALKSIMEVY